MIKEGALGDAEAIFGMHIDAMTPTGVIATVSGPVLAAVSTFEARIEGKGGHAAAPHNSVDPILAASFAILALQQLISREVDPLESQVCPSNLSFFTILCCGLSLLYHIQVSPAPDLYPSPKIPNNFASWTFIICEN